MTAHCDDLISLVQKGILLGIIGLVCGDEVSSRFASVLFDHLDVEQDVSHTISISVTTENCSD